MWSFKHQDEIIWFIDVTKKKTRAIKQITKDLRNSEQVLNFILGTWLTGQLPVRLEIFIGIVCRSWKRKGPLIYAYITWSDATDTQKSKVGRTNCWNARHKLKSKTKTAEQNVGGAVLYLCSWRPFKVQRRAPWRILLLDVAITFSLLYQYKLRW